MWHSSISGIARTARLKDWSAASRVSESRTSTGWTAGVGAEIALTRNWSAKVEYLYVDLSDRNFSLTGMPNGYEFSTVRVGVNYRF